MISRVLSAGSVILGITGAICLFGAIYSDPVMKMFGHGSVEDRILHRQDHAPHPEEGATVPCELKGGDFYCTPFEAQFEQAEPWVLIGGAALASSGIGLSALGRHLGKRPA